MVEQDRAHLGSVVGSVVDGLGREHHAMHEVASALDPGVQFGRLAQQPLPITLIRGVDLGHVLEVAVLGLPPGLLRFDANQLSVAEERDKYIRRDQRLIYDQ